MGTLGPAEILVILVVALIVLGPDRLPEAARKAGQFIAEVRRIGNGFQAEVRDAMRVPTDPNTTATPAVRALAPVAPPGPSGDVAVPPPPARPEPPEQLP